MVSTAFKKTCSMLIKKPETEIVSGFSKKSYHYFLFNHQPSHKPQIPHPAK